MDTFESSAALLAAGTQWHERAIALIEDREAHEAAYAELSGNLRGVVSTMMDFSGTVDANDPAPTNVDGGTFNTIRDVIHAAPFGSSVLVRLAPGETYPLDIASIRVENREVQLRKIGEGPNPIVAPVSYFDAQDDINRFYFFTVSSGALIAVDVDFALPAKANPAKEWGRRSLVEYTGFFTRVALLNGTFSGQDDQAVCDCNIGTIIALTLTNMTMNGAVYGVITAGLGVALMTQRNTAYVNGAQLVDGGVRGENILHN